MWNDIETDRLSEISISYSLSDTKALDGFANLFSDPQFVSPENNDFTLQESSSCIDAGDPDSPLDPDGTISDIGACFFKQDTTSNISDKSGLESVNIYPNPFTSVFNIKYHLQHPSNVKIELYNVNGMMVETILNKSQIAGDYKIAVTINESKTMEDGFYICFVSFDNAFKGFKVMRIN